MSGYLPPGVSPEVAEERGYTYIRTWRQLEAHDPKLTERQQQIPGVLIPVYRLGKLPRYAAVLRPDHPRIGADGQAIKYEWPQGVPLCLDVLPRYCDALRDTRVPLWITEGAKKADALASAFGTRIVPLNVNGVYGWRRKDGSGASHPLDDLDQIAWDTRVVVLAFDSDVTRKAEVQKALHGLAKHLKSRGANVRVLVLPQSGDQKLGVDDAIATGMTAEDLEAYVCSLKKFKSLLLVEPSLTDTSLACGSETAAAALADADILAFFRDAPPTDAGNAECLVLYGKDRLRYCHTREKWLSWTDTRWQIDVDGEAQRHALHIARLRRMAAAQIPDPDRAKRAFLWSLASESTARRSAMLQTAAILYPFTTTVDCYDQDPLLAPVCNGTLDLRTGELRAARREDYLTMQLGTSYDPQAACPRWLHFLEEVFAGDQDLIAYLQRAVGYSLTGDTREQKLFLCNGSGSNGKSVFLEIVAALLGDYAANASFDTFDAGRRNEATNDLAALKGKRLVTVIETDDDRRLAEARVKAVTGQDLISCRYLYGEFFSYRPQFKLWMAMNYKPIIRGTDRGIWRRIALIPFTQSFEGREEKTLVATLRAELPGILNWALAGLRQWHAQGLGTCAAVEQATKEYQQESDFVGQWLEECTEQDPTADLTTTAAIASFATWCKLHGYREPTDRFLGRRLGELGYERGMVGSQRRRCYRGLRLIETDEQGDRYDRYDRSFPETPLSKNPSRKVSENSDHIDHIDHPPTQEQLDNIQSTDEESLPSPPTPPEPGASGFTRRDLAQNAGRGRIAPGSSPPEGNFSPALPSLITPEKVRFVREKLSSRGSAWARRYMDDAEGFEKWPAFLRHAVEEAAAAERAAALADT